MTDEFLDIWTAACGIGFLAAKGFPESVESEILPGWPEAEQEGLEVMARNPYGRVNVEAYKRSRERTGHNFVNFAAGLTGKQVVH